MSDTKLSNKRRPVGIAMPRKQAKRIDGGSAVIGVVREVGGGALGAVCGGQSCLRGSELFAVEEEDSFDAGADGVGVEREGTDPADLGLVVAGGALVGQAAAE